MNIIIALQFSKNIFFASVNNPPNPADAQHFGIKSVNVMTVTNMMQPEHNP